MVRQLFVALLLLTGSIAWAEDEQNTSRARIHLKAGIAYYDDGRYDDAAREMRAAYDLRPLPDLQYNLAQCYERLHQLEGAAQAYETYLRGKSDASDRASVQARIDNLRARAQAEAAGQALPAPITEEKVVFKTIVVYREKAAPPGRAARWAAYGLGALALAGLATGIAYAVLAKSAADEVTRGGNVMNPPTFDGKLRDTQDSGKTYPIVAGVGFGVAAVAAAGAVALYAFSKKIDKEAQKREQQAFNWSLSPSLGPSGGGLLLAGSFR
jgi:tetratricopeptide (TPR) repeat protein